MIAVILSFTDDPARLELRPAHREKAAALVADGTLAAGGPFADQSGALLLFSTDDMGAVEAALADDPYYSAPGVRVATVQPWTVVSGGVVAHSD